MKKPEKKETEQLLITWEGGSERIVVPLPDDPDWSKERTDFPASLDWSQPQADPTATDAPQARAGARTESAPRRLPKGGSPEDEETVLANLLFLIRERFGTDVAFERAAGIPPKTVSNWRRGISSSFMKQLPALAALLQVRLVDLLPPDAVDEGEAAFLKLYRKTAAMLPEERHRFLITMQELMGLYIDKYLHRRRR